MKKLNGKVAVITGAASGIGRALASRCAEEGMKTVLADVDEERLGAAAAELRSSGASVLAVPADVSKARDVERVARRTLDEFGAVQLLVNNAGVGLVGPAIWEATLADWDWILGVNLRGVVHGLRVFVPIMLEQGTPCHIVNTASAAGLFAPPGMGVYNTSKAGVVALSETLHRELALRKAAAKVSVLCSGFVKTEMLEAARNRPAELQNDPDLEAHRRALYAARDREMREAMRTAMSPEDLAGEVIAAVRDERFYIFTHPWVRDAIRLRAENIAQNRNPWEGLDYENSAI